VTVPAPGAADPLLRFYRLEGPDDRGRMLTDIWQWDHRRLEAVHDYIQWLFPLAERSAFNPGAPTLTPATIAGFRDDSTLQAHLRRSLALMLAFYGLELVDDGAAVKVIRAAAFDRRSREWLRPGDHNHLRLTRILTSLRLLGLEAHGAALYACLAEIARDHPDRVSSATVGFWQRALTG
jgi:hypothetical protein